MNYVTLQFRNRDSTCEIYCPRKPSLLADFWKSAMILVVFLAVGLPTCVERAHLDPVLRRIPLLARFVA